MSSIAKAIGVALMITLSVFTSKGQGSVESALSINKFNCIKDGYGNVLAYETKNKHISTGVRLKKIKRSQVTSASDSTQLTTEETELDTTACNIVVYAKATNKITDAAGVVIGEYKNSTKEFTDINNHVLFSINTSNQIVNAAGVVLGRVESNGDVYEANGLKRGSGENIDAYKLAYFFFFANR